ncbi:hypothetical protein C357_02154, partial [Citreicella sp. 357]
LEPVLAQDLLIVVRTVLRSTIRVMNAIAIFNARMARFRFIRLLTAQPITRREWRSKITARYSQPSRVQT